MPLENKIILGIIISSSLLLSIVSLILLPNTEYEKKNTFINLDSWIYVYSIFNLLYLSVGTGFYLIQYVIRNNRFKAIFWLFSFKATLFLFVWGILGIPTLFAEPENNNNLFFMTAINITGEFIIFILSILLYFAKYMKYLNDNIYSPI